MPLRQARWAAAPLHLSLLCLPHSALPSRTQTPQTHIYTHTHARTLPRPASAPQYCRIIQRLGFEAEFREFTIQNVVASCDVKFPIRLEGLQYSHAYFATVRRGGGGGWGGGRGAAVDAGAGGAATGAWTGGVGVA